MFKTSPANAAPKLHACAETKQRRRRRTVTLVAGVAASALAIGVVLWVVRTYAYPSGAISNCSAATALPHSEPWVHGELLCDQVRQDAANIKLPHKADGHYFFWFFESRSNPAQDPLVVWLSGGPGCSGLWSLLVENGPCVVESDLTTTRNPHSWNEHANVVWLDQPLLTGFSHGRVPDDLDTSSTSIGENLYWFLQGFYTRHPSLRGRQVFLAGEGHAGQFIPVAAYTIHRRNRQLDVHNATLSINLSGVMIGNGLTVPTVQNQHVLDMAVHNPYGTQFMVNNTAQNTKASTCLNYTEECQSSLSVGPCVYASIQCAADLAAVFNGSDRNPFDTRLTCPFSHGYTCYPTPHVDTFLNSPPLQAYLGVGTNSTSPRRWIHCNRDVASDFLYSGDLMKDRHRYLGRLLDDSNLRVLIYAGDADLTFNWMGNDAWTRQLVWRYTSEFQNAPEVAFRTSDGSNVGTVRSVGTVFSFVRVFQAGHLVAKDQPEVALEMVRRFLRNESLA